MRSYSSCRVVASDLFILLYPFWMCVVLHNKEKEIEVEGNEINKEEKSLFFFSLDANKDSIDCLLPGDEDAMPAAPSIQNEIVQLHLLSSSSLEARRWGGRTKKKKRREISHLRCCWIDRGPGFIEHSRKREREQSCSVAGPKTGGGRRKAGNPIIKRREGKKKVSPASPPSINVPPNQSSAGYQRERRRGTRASTIGRGWNLLHVNLGRSYRLLTVIQLFLFSSVPPRV